MIYNPSSRTILTVLELSFTLLFLAALIDCLSFSSFACVSAAIFPPSPTVPVAQHSYLSVVPESLPVCALFQVLALSPTLLQATDGSASACATQSGHTAPPLCRQQSIFLDPSPHSIEQFTSYFGADLVTPLLNHF